VIQATAEYQGDGPNADIAEFHEQEPVQASMIPISSKPNLSRKIGDCADQCDARLDLSNRWGTNRVADNRSKLLDTLGIAPQPP